MTAPAPPLYDLCAEDHAFLPSLGTFWATIEGKKESCTLRLSRQFSIQCFPVTATAVDATLHTNLCFRSQRTLSPYLTAIHPTQHRPAVCEAHTM